MKQHKRWVPITRASNLPPTREKPKITLSLTAIRISSIVVETSGSTREVDGSPKRDPALLVVSDGIRPVQKTISDYNGK